MKTCVHHKIHLYWRDYIPRRTTQLPIYIARIPHSFLQCAAANSLRSFKTAPPVPHSLTLLNMTASPPPPKDAEPVPPTQSRQPHLSHQDASAVDPTKLTALTPEVVRPSCVGPLPSADDTRGEVPKRLLFVRFLSHVFGIPFGLFPYRFLARRP